MYLHTFERLEVWQLSRKLAVDIYKMCSGFPKEEIFGLSSQLKRAAISIASNIAEGSSRISGKDKAHFSTVAFASLMEVLNQLIIANDLGFLETEKLAELRVSINEITNKLNALRRSQMNS